MPLLYFGPISRSLPGVSQMILHFFRSHPTRVKSDYALLKVHCLCMQMDMELVVHFT
jgi:hypothetical protein